MALRLRRIADRRFLAGIFCGVVVVALGRVVINETSFADRLIAPLLLSDSSGQADAIVVLGAGVVGDCVPNLNSMRRILRGARLFRDGRAPLLVLTGGAPIGECAVADAMMTIAEELGVPQDKILIERQSHSTRENGERTAPLLQQRNVERILVVTDRLHMRRAASVFARLGFVVEPSAVPIYEGHLDNVSMLSAGIREAAALTVYRLRGWTAAAGQQVQPADRTVTPASQGDERVQQSGGSVDRISFQPATRTTRPMVILGASYAASWDLGGLSVDVINAGVPGEQSSDMLARFDRDVLTVQPRAVLLWGFINDLFRADQMDRALPRIRESYLEMIKRARENGIEPVLATEVTVRPPLTFLDTIKSTAGWLLRKRSYQDQVNHYVIEMNQWLRETASRDALLLLDLQSTLASRDGQRRRQFATEDGSHITPDGYAALTRYAAPILSRRLTAPPTSP